MSKATELQVIMGQTEIKTMTQTVTINCHLQATVGQTEIKTMTQTVTINCHLQATVLSTLK